MYTLIRFLPPGILISSGGDTFHIFGVVSARYLPCISVVIFITKLHFTPPSTGMAEPASADPLLAGVALLAGQLAQANNVSEEERSMLREQLLKIALVRVGTLQAAEPASATNGTALPAATTRQSSQATAPDPAWATIEGPGLTQAALATATLQAGRLLRAPAAARSSTATTTTTIGHIDAANDAGAVDSPGFQDDYSDSGSYELPDAADSGFTPPHSRIAIASPPPSARGTACGQFVRLSRSTADGRTQLRVRNQAGQSLVLAWSASSSAVANVRRRLLRESVQDMLSVSGQQLCELTNVVTVSPWPLDQAWVDKWGDIAGARAQVALAGSSPIEDEPGHVFIASAPSAGSEILMQTATGPMLLCTCQSATIARRALRELRQLLAELCTVSSPSADMVAAAGLEASNVYAVSPWPLTLEFMQAPAVSGAATSRPARRAVTGSPDSSDEVSEEDEHDDAASAASHDPAAYFHDELPESAEFFSALEQGQFSCFSESHLHRLVVAHDSVAWSLGKANRLVCERARSQLQHWQKAAPRSMVAALCNLFGETVSPCPVSRTSNSTQPRHAKNVKLLPASAWTQLQHIPGANRFATGLRNGLYEIVFLPTPAKGGAVARARALGALETAAHQLANTKPARFGGLLRRNMLVADVFKLPEAQYVANLTAGMKFNSPQRPRSRTPAVSSLISETAAPASSSSSREAPSHLSDKPSLHFPVHAHSTSVQKPRRGRKPGQKPRRKQSVSIAAPADAPHVPVDTAAGQLHVRRATLMRYALVLVLPDDVAVVLCRGISVDALQQLRRTLAASLAKQESTEQQHRHIRDAGLRPALPWLLNADWTLLDSERDAASPAPGSGAMLTLTDGAVDQGELAVYRIANSNYMLKEVWPDGRELDVCQSIDSRGVTYLRDQLIEARKSEASLTQQRLIVRAAGLQPVDLWHSAPTVPVSMASEERGELYESSDEEQDSPPPDAADLESMVSPSGVDWPLSDREDGTTAPPTPKAASVAAAWQVAKRAPAAPGGGTLLEIKRGHELVWRWQLLDHELAESLREQVSSTALLDTMRACQTALDAKHATHQVMLDALRPAANDTQDHGWLHAVQDVTFPHSARVYAGLPRQTIEVRCSSVQAAHSLLEALNRAKMHQDRRKVSELVAQHQVLFLRDHPDINSAKAGSMRLERPAAEDGHMTTTSPEDESSSMSSGASPRAYSSRFIVGRKRGRTHHRRAGSPHSSADSDSSSVVSCCDRRYLGRITPMDDE